LKIYKLLAVFTILVVFNSCGGSGSSECSVANKKSFVYELLHDIYYWADSVEDSDISDFKDEYEVLDNLKDKRDRYSFITTNKVYDNYFVSTTNDDFGMLNSEKNNSIIRFVYPNSPASIAGIKRSDRILSYKVMDDNLSVDFKFLVDGSIVKNVIIKPFEYEKKEIVNPKVFDLNGTKVGYFVLNSFIGKNIVRDLNSTFKSFKKSNVDELIIDLRDNGGGDIDIAANLASLISGKKSVGHIFQHHNYNLKYSENNNNSYFVENSNSLDLNRVFVITTHNTASASESLISALRASENHMEVIIVGSKSYGKPYSMIAIPFCNHVIFPILMKNLNSENMEDYDDGFTPTCKADDNLSYDFGDVDESSLKEAIYYIENSSCSN